MKYKVTAYLKTQRRESFPARDLGNARDIAARIVNEYLQVINEDGSEEFFPPTELHKVKIERVILGAGKEEL